MSKNCSDPFDIVRYFIKCVTTSWTHSTSWTDTCSLCPGSSDPIYIVTYYIKWVTTCWTDTSINGKKYWHFWQKKVVHLDIHFTQPQVGNFKGRKKDFWVAPTKGWQRTQIWQMTGVITPPPSTKKLFTLFWALQFGFKLIIQ